MDGVAVDVNYRIFRAVDFDVLDLAWVEDNGEVGSNHEDRFGFPPCQFHGYHLCPEGQRKGDGGVYV